MQETYEVINYGSKYKLGTVLTLSELNKKEIEELIENRIIEKMQGELLFDSSAKTSFEII